MEKNKNKRIKIDKTENQSNRIELQQQKEQELDIIATKNNNIEIGNDKKKVSENNILENEIKNISNFICSIENELKIRNERDKYKDEAIQRMSKQIADFEKGIFEKIKIELIKEIISFYNILLNFKNKFKHVQDKEFQKEFQREINFLETEMSNLLFNNGVDELENELNIDFDRNYHRIKRKIETSNKELHNKIANILKKGFIWEDKVLIKQEIEVFEYKENGNE